MADEETMRLGFERQHNEEPFPGPDLPAPSGHWFGDGTQRTNWPTPPMPDKRPSKLGGKTANPCLKQYPEGYHAA
ncbi:hypothetical protein CgunFtcFv8_019843 [Champsocephalus gunnari]|uniref:Uncharacterized protein n=1 Tax=Champsocephalus gunnari TaxID=52237 RepID=A0AAN8HP88_CHAGU|nr:hypothetical protein CgunFtcFv8_019843 [Champsocephalus gunnari]